MQVEFEMEGAQYTAEVNVDSDDSGSFYTVDVSREDDQKMKAGEERRARQTAIAISGL